MTTARCLVLATAIVTAVSGAPALANSTNPYLQAGIDLYLDFEYEAALEQLKKAASLENNARFDKIQIGLWLGYIRMELGDEEGARADFMTALRLDPKLELPAKVSPKVAVVFESARDQVLATIPIVPPPVAMAPAEPPVASTPSAPAEKPAPASDPNLARSAGVSSAVHPPESDQGRKAEVAPPSGEERARVLLAHSEPVPAEAISGRSPSQVETYTTSGRVLAYVLVGAGAVLAGSGAFFGARSSSTAAEAEDAHFQSDAASRLDAAQGQALTANILFGAAGTAVVGGIISFLAGGPSTESSSNSQVDSTPELEPAAAPARRDESERDPFDPFD